MKGNMFKFLFLAVLFCSTAQIANAQKPRKSTKRTTKTKTNANIQTTEASTDPVPPPPVASAPEPKPDNDSLPLKVVKVSLRPDEAVETSVLRERTPLAYEHLRADDAV